jgi:hypothetical protein
MSATPAEVCQHLAAVHAEAGGLLRVWRFAPSDGVRLLLAAEMGDAWARGMLAAISDCVQQVTAAPKRRSVLCLTCPAPIRTATGATFLVTVPGVDEARHALGSAICPACARRGDLDHLILVALREVWPSLREIRPMLGPETVQ